MKRRGGQRHRPRLRGAVRADFLVLHRRMNALETATPQGMLRLLDAVRWPMGEGTPDRVMLFGSARGAVAALQPAPPALPERQLSLQASPLIALRVPTDTPLRLAGGVTPPVAAPEWPLFAGRDVLVALREGERAEEAADWLRYHVRFHGMTGAVIVNRLGPGGEGADFAARLADRLEAPLRTQEDMTATPPVNEIARRIGFDHEEEAAAGRATTQGGGRGDDMGTNGSKAADATGSAIPVVVLDCPIAIGRTDLPPAAHPFNAPDAPGKDRMMLPAPDPWTAPLGEGNLWELVRWRFLETARAVANVDLSDLLALPAATLEKLAAESGKRTGLRRSADRKKPPAEIAVAAEGGGAARSAAVARGRPAAPKAPEAGRQTSEAGLSASGEDMGAPDDDAGVLDEGMDASGTAADAPDEGLRAPGRNAAAPDDGRDASRLDGAASSLGSPGGGMSVTTSDRPKKGTSRRGSPRVTNRSTSPAGKERPPGDGATLPSPGDVASAKARASRSRPGTGQEATPEPPGTAGGEEPPAEHAPAIVTAGAQDDTPSTVFDLVLRSATGVIQLSGRRVYPWRVRKGAFPHYADHICRQFDSASRNRRWCIDVARTRERAVWRLARIGNINPDPARIGRFWRFMALRHPEATASELVPKTSLIEDADLLRLARGVFAHKPVRQPRNAVREPRREDVTIVTTMKNEGPFILEWIAYHRMIGVENFLIYTNDCTDGTDVLLDLLQKKGIVQHRDNPFRETGLKPQHAALQAAEKERVIRDAGWIICMDVDEFINIHVGEGRLHDLFAAIGDANMISLTWRLFGNSDIHEYRDDFIIRQFVRCAPKMVRKPHQAWGFKTLFRNIGIFKKLGVHRPKGLRPDLHDEVRWVNGSGQPIPPQMIRNAWRSTISSVGYDLVTLNHYAVRSAESFLVKRDRGRVNHVDRDQGLNYWFRMNHNAEEDRSIQRMLPALEREFAALMADPEIRAAHEYCVRKHREKIAELKSRSDYAAFYRELTSPRMEKLSRHLRVFGSAVFLSGPEVIPDEIVEKLDSLPPDFFFTIRKPTQAA